MKALSPFCTWHPLRLGAVVPRSNWRLSVDMKSAILVQNDVGHNWMSLECSKRVHPVDDILAIVMRLKGRRKPPPSLPPSLHPCLGVSGQPLEEGEADYENGGLTDKDPLTGRDMRPEINALVSSRLVGRILSSLLFLRMAFRYKK